MKLQEHMQTNNKTQFHKTASVNVIVMNIHHTPSRTSQTKTTWEEDIYYDKHKNKWVEQYNKHITHVGKTPLLVLNALTLSFLPSLPSPIHHSPQVYF